MGRLSNDMASSARAILTVLMTLVAILTTAFLSSGELPRPLDNIAYATGAETLSDIGQPSSLADGDSADHAHDVPYVAFSTVRQPNGPRLPDWLTGNPALAEGENRMRFERPPRS